MELSIGCCRLTNPAKCSVSFSVRISLIERNTNISWKRTSYEFLDEEAPSFPRKHDLHVVISLICGYKWNYYREKSNNSQMISFFWHLMLLYSGRVTFKPQYRLHVSIMLHFGLQDLLLVELCTAVGTFMKCYAFLCNECIIENDRCNSRETQLFTQTLPIHCL